MSDIRLDLIDPNPDQPRQTFDETGIEELAQSMEAKGLIVPIMVRPDGDRYVIVHGERRWRAAMLLKWEMIPAEVWDIDAAEAFKLALIENVQRQDLAPTEEALAFRKLIDDDGMTQAEIGTLIGKSQQYVADRLALLRLPDKVQDLVTARAVSPSIARRLVTIGDPKVQTSLARQAVKENLTVKDIEKAQMEWNMEVARDRQRSLTFEELVNAVPELAQYADAVKKGEIELKQSGFVSNLRTYLVIQTLTKEFTGQDWHWPRYSGIEFLTRPAEYSTGVSGLDKNGENLTIPTFSEDEWKEVCRWYNERWDLFRAINFPGCKWFELKHRYGPPDKVPLPYERWTYDPDFGCTIADSDSGFFLPFGAFKEDPKEFLFVKKGWGTWCIVEFNDGQGGRIRRRYFSYDHLGRTLIEQAVNTVDPFAFSHHNFGRLKLWQAQKFEMSWWYIRRKTISREEAIEAMEADLETLRNAKELDDEEFTERVLNWLQEYIPSDPTPHVFREGLCTFPRRPDGTVDEELYRKLQKEIWS